ncbi:MAG: glycosyltransferase [Armatimonadota bacterium]|nr:glycosyltransferase [bacterium]MDW8320601.1 glycosyltransferase [Armatimonadota bacterium]
MRRVFAVVPAHNEAMTVAETVRALRQLPAEVVVVADACTDETAQRAHETGATVLVRRERGDKARALAKGLRWIQEQQPSDDDVVLLVDADVGTSASEVTHLLEAVASNGTDMAIGVLPPAGRHGGFGLVARFARWALQRRTGERFRAPLSGQRAMRWQTVRQLTALAGGFGVEVGMTIDVARARARVQEVDVCMVHRHTGRSWRGFLHRARQGWHVLLASMGVRQVTLWTDDC